MASTAVLIAADPISYLQNAVSAPHDMEVGSVDSCREIPTPQSAITKR